MLIDFIKITHIKDMKESKKIAITGVAGFIATNLAMRLISQGHDIYGIDIREPEFLDKSKFNFTLGDLTNPAVCKKFFNQPFDQVFTLAANMGGAGFIFTGDNDAEVMHNSALINLNVAHFSSQAKVKQLFFSSSVCAYSQDQVKQKIKEEDIYPANPDSNYGWEKIFSERVYQAYAKNKGLNIRIARFNNCFGPRSVWEGGREKSPAAICRKALTQDPIEIWGNGEQIREFIYIDDLLDAIEIIMQSDDKDPINIGPDESYTIDEMVRMVSDKEIKHIDGPVGLQVRLTDNTKIKSLGWSPKISVKDGMLKLKSWIQDQKLA